MNPADAGRPWLGRIATLLNEAVMGFLALAALGVGLAPLLFPLSEGVEQVFDAVEWAIVALFAIEYVANFMLAPDRRAFALQPWRLLDAAIILTPLLSLLPAISDAVRSTPALRVLRLLRALLFGPLVGHGLPRAAAPAARAAPQGEPQVTLLRPGDGSPSGRRWDELLRWAEAPAGEWLHASNLTPGRLAEVAAAAGIPHVLIEAALHESSYPRIEAGARWSALTLSLPSATEVTHRDPILLLVSEDGLLSLAPHPLDLQRAPRVLPGAGAVPWGPSCALRVIGLVLARDEALAGNLESTVRRLEQVPASSSPQSFFEETFRLKRVLSTAKGDLWRLHGLLEMISDGRRRLPGLEPEQRQAVAQLAEEADYLYETIDEIREAVLSLIELHIDVAAHDTTRFMRLLAIVSTLALIPALAGGLLGMNLVDAPWTVTLGQVAFGTLILMFGVLYAFMAKGWLR